MLQALDRPTQQGTHGITCEHGIVKALKLGN